MIINPNGLKKLSDNKMDKLEKDIKKRFDNFEASPPAELWSSIESRLDAKDAVRTGYKRRRITAIAAAVLLFLISTAGLLLNQFGLRIVPVAQQTSTSSSQDQENNDVFRTPPLSTESIEPATNNRDNELKADVKSSDLTEQQNPLLAREEKGYETEDSPINTQIIFSDIAASSTMPALYAETGSLLSLHPGLEEVSIKLSAKNKNGKENYDVRQIDVHLANNHHDTPSSYSLSTYFAPQQAYRYQNRNASHPMQALESEIMTFAAGLQVNYRINNRWEIQSGLGFNRIGQRIKDIAAFSHPSKMALYSTDGAPITEHPQSMNTSMGGVVFTDQRLYFADISSSRIITLKGSYDESIVNLLNKTGTGLIQHFEYLEMPVNVRYKLWQQGFEISAKAGLSANYLLSGKVFLPEQTQGTPIGKVVGVNTLNLSGMAGLVFSYPVLSKVSMSLEPTASMFLTPMGNVRNLTRETHPYSWSVMMGLSYKL